MEWYTLDLVNEGMQDAEVKYLKYKTIQYSDSQEQIVIEPISGIPNEVSVVIQSRMSWDDIQLICCAVGALKEMGIKKIYLRIPYLLGARSDRVFEKGWSLYLRDVAAPILNSLDLREIQVLDEHSKVAFQYIKNLYSLIDLYNYFISISLTEVIEDFEFGNVLILAPDKGAYEKVETIAKQHGISFLYCSKERDAVTGKITTLKVPDIKEQAKKVIIIDDICDGGATFITIAKQLKEKGISDIYLIVTHGVFSKGFGELSQYFRKIITTNSVLSLISLRDAFNRGVDVSNRCSLAVFDVFNFKKSLTKAITKS